MTRVLALDLATNTGVAIIDDTGVPFAASWDLLDGVRTTGKFAPTLDTRHVMAVQSLRNRLRRLIGIHRPDVVAVEREFGRGVGQRFLVALYTAANEAAYDASLPCLAVRLGDWRRHIHGSAGRTTEFYKDEALRLCAADGIHVPDADAGEAVLIGRYVHATVRFHDPVAAPATTTARAA